VFLCVYERGPTRLGRSAYYLQLFYCINQSINQRSSHRLGLPTVVCVECLPADKPWDVVSVTRRSSGVATRACVRVYARVLVPPNLYVHTYIPNKATRGQRRSHIPAPPQGVANPASRSDAGLGGCDERVASRDSTSLRNLFI